MTAHVGALSEDAITALLALIERMLRDPSVSLHVDRGVRYRDNYDTGFEDAELTEGRTVRIEVHGGAREERESDAVKLARLQQVWRRDR